MATRPIKTAVGEQARPAPTEAAPALASEAARKEKILQRYRKLGLNLERVNKDGIGFSDGSDADENEHDSDTEEDSDEYSSDEYVTFEEEDD